MHGHKLRYRYDHYTWPEMKAVIERQPVCLLPIGSVEDHGRHLPLDVDNFLIGTMCEEVGRRIPDEVLLLPAIPFGFEDHHMSFPGTRSAISGGTTSQARNSVFPFGRRLKS